MVKAYIEIELPESCSVCPFRDKLYGDCYPDIIYCNLLDQYSDECRLYESRDLDKKDHPYNTERHERCPLIIESEE